MMAKLVKTGVFGNRSLEVCRNGKWMAQYCPRQQEKEWKSEREPQHAQCGEWCPMFEVNDGQDVQLKCAPRLVLLNLEVGQ